MTAQLLLWPLFPLVGVWLRRSAAAWAGVALGGAGLAGSLFWGGAPWGPLASAAVAWALCSVYVLRCQKGIEADRRDAMRALAQAKEQVMVLEKEHVELKHEFEKQSREEASAFQVYSLAKSLTESLSWDSLVNRFAYVLQKVTGSTDFLLYLSSNNSGKLELYARNGAWEMGSLPPAPPQRHAQWLPSGRDTLLQLPLWQDQELMGLLWVRWADASHPSVTDIEQVFEHLLIGFQKAQLFARMESMSRLDGLTKVLRRQPFMEHTETEWHRASTFKTGFCLMIVDVDHFKRINDTHGHPAGDAVLARLGVLLKESLYETDSVGRYGGEEFGILLPRAEPEGVRRKAEGLRARVAAEIFAFGREALSVTVSIGMAHYPRDGKTVPEVLAAADRALYTAKQSGRNRVVDFGEVR